MNDDIYFYDLEFNLLYILPAFSESGGYISVNCDKDFNGNGSLEIIFYDEALKQLIKSKPTEIFLRWGNFEGFITSYQFTNLQYRIMGMSLNGLVHRAVVPITNVGGTAESIAKYIITQHVPWLIFGNNAGFTKNITFATDTYKPCDEVLQDLFDKDSGGYEIASDIKNKKFIFNPKKMSESNLILSDGNLNAYNFTEDFNGKEIAYSGWYKNSSNEWQSITTQSKSGIYGISCVLSAGNATDAAEELKEKKAEKSITADIKSLQYGVDYQLGDIVRLQNDDITVKKVITSVNIHRDNGYGTTPTFKDWED